MAKVHDIEYFVVSDCDREDLYVDLSSSNFQWGEIKLVKPDNDMIITLYLDVGEADIEVNYCEFMRILEEAGDKLLKTEGSYSPL